MLFTRCPECETTFRVTDETLKKANGQVRCGRCASVFNAYAELHDPAAKSFEPETAPPRAVVEQPAETPIPIPTPPAPPPSPPAPPPDDKSARPSSDDAPAAAASVANVSAEAEQAAAESAAEAETPLDPDAISATEVERVLTTTVNPPLPPMAYAWPTAGAVGERHTSRWWSVAVALAVLVLGAQALHHFRSTLVGNETFGPWIAQVYGAFGAELTPRWDVRQYEILDWVASAEPNSRGLGRLKITARIQNRGPQRQPYPAVQLRLKDRWEEAVGSRMFTPAEYLSTDTPRGRLMSPGETARAEIEVVDPGPDAYGFELDVCIEVEASLVTCGTDKVFM